MAQKRMLDKKITTSERVNDLGLLGALLYTWAIPVADDFGILQGSPRTIKAQVIPMVDVSLKEVEECIQKMIDFKLWEHFTIDDRSYYRITGFEDNQKLRQDMQPNTILPVELEKEYLISWQKCNEMIEKYTSFGRNRTTSDEIGTEVKISKEKIREDSINNNDKNSFEFSDLSKFSSNGKSQEFQIEAERITNALEIPEDRKSAYFKAIKEEKRGLILQAYSFAADYPKPELRDKMFFWRLNQLKTNNGTG